MIYIDTITGLHVIPDTLDGVTRVKKFIDVDREVSVEGEDGEAVVKNIKVKEFAGWALEGVPAHIKLFDPKDPRLSVVEGEYLAWEGGEPVKRAVVVDGEIAVAKVKEKFKADRAAAVRGITVEVDGMVFDGNEESQNRMTRAITAALSDDEVTTWRLADNTNEAVTCAQLRAALRAALEAQAQVWFQE